MAKKEENTLKPITPTIDLGWDHKKDRVKSWQEKSSLRSYDRSKSEKLFSIVKIICVLILILSLSSLILGTNSGVPLSFESLLNFLGSVEQVDMSQMLNFQSLTVDFDESLPIIGAILGAFETIINMTLSVFTVLSYLFTGLFTAVQFLLNFLRFVFIV